MLKYRLDNFFIVADGLPFLDPSIYLGKEGYVRLEGELAPIPCLFQAVNNVFIAGEGIRTTMKIWHNCLQNISGKKIVDVRLGNTPEMTKQSIANLDPPGIEVLPNDAADTIKLGIDLDKNAEQLVNAKIPEGAGRTYLDQVETIVSEKANLYFLSKLIPEELVRESERVWTDEEFSSIFSARMGRVLALYIDWIEYGHIALLKKETAYLTLMLYLLRKRIDKCGEWEAIISKQAWDLESEIARAKTRKATKLLALKTATKNLNPGDMSE